MSSEHLHLYTMKGRCTGSQPLGDETYETWQTTRSRTGLPVSCRMQYQFLSQGLRLTFWSEADQTGLATGEGGDLIVRLKPVGFVRDMKAAGVTQALEAVRRNGAAIEMMTGRPLSEDAGA